MAARDRYGWDGYWDAFFAEDEVFYGHVPGYLSGWRLRVPRSGAPTGP
jgi:hypothetical protein